MPDIRYMPTSHVDLASNWLVKHARKSMSQIGQDGILDKIYEVIGHHNKFCIEFGAWDGKKYSNTWELIAEKGWAGLLIEGNKDRCEEISHNHNHNPKVTALNMLVGYEGDNRLDLILDSMEAPLEPDFLSVDIDGNDWHVWNALEKYRPRVILIEFNPSIPNDIYFVQDANPDVRQGSSLRAMIELGRSKGYSLICAHKWDAIFVPDDLYPKFGIEDNSIDKMYDQTPFGIRIFYGFDGTVYSAGRTKMMWANATFYFESIQLLPRKIKGS